MDTTPCARFGNQHLLAAWSLGNGAQKLRIHSLVRDELLWEFSVRSAADGALHHPQPESLILIAFAEFPDASPMDNQIPSALWAGDVLGSCKNNDVALVYSSTVCYTYHSFCSATRKPEAVAFISTLRSTGYCFSFSTIQFFRLGLSLLFSQERCLSGIPARSV